MSWFEVIYGPVIDWFWDRWLDAEEWYERQARR